MVVHASMCWGEEGNQNGELRQYGSNSKFKFQNSKVKIPVVLLLERTLHAIIDRALEAQQQEEEEDFLVSYDPLNPNTVPVRPQQVPCGV